MKKIFLAFFLLSHALVAQKISIKGQLKDSLNGPLPSATILVLNISDSSLVNFGASGPDGSFEIKNLNRQDYWLKATYVGFQPMMKKVSPAATDIVVDVGLVRMYPNVRELKEVTIEADKAPVTIKKDTIEFNATTFKTQQNAVVEDLLKKLPGVEVDNDGTIRAQGEEVKRVTVDGKEFFGKDPKLATRNLPADAIGKVQVYDKKSDQTAFSGIDDGEREKTINLELKPEKRNAAFGNITGGVGTDDRYLAKANINRFRKGEQLSFLGMANNTNEQGFGIDEYINFTSSSQQMMGGGRNVRVQVNAGGQNGIPLNIGGRRAGIMENYAGGLNYNKTFNTKTDLNASYFYNHLDHDLTQSLERLTYLDSGNLTFNQQSRQRNTNANHRLNTILEHKMDSMNSIKWTNTVTYNETDAHEESTSQNLSIDNSLLNESERITNSNGASVNLNSNFLWRHRFARKGRTLSANLQLTLVDTDRDGDQQSLNKYYTGTTGEESIVQTSTQHTGTYTYAGTLTYTEPLGNRKYLEANYSFRHNANTVDKQVYDVNNGESILNTNLTNQYNSDYQYHRAGLNFRLNRSAYSITAGGSLQQTYLDGLLKTTGTNIAKSYQNILPAAHFNYDFSNSKHVRFDYETSVQEPTIQQLQPVVDNTDPLNLTVGNPDLRPAYEHSWRANFITFDPATFINFFAFVNASYTRNAITTAQSYTEQQVRISQPVNVDHNLRVNSNAAFGFPIKKLGSRVQLTANYSHEKGINVLNDLQSNTLKNVLGGILRYDFRYQEILDINLSANISRQSTHYEFNEESDQLFFNEIYRAETNLSFLRNFQFTSALEYLVYESKTTDYKQSIPLLNLSISRFILKAKSGELKFSVNNVLDKNVGVTQTADINYFERQVSNSLGRYYMLSFTYALNKQLNPAAMRPRGGGMINIIR